MGSDSEVSARITDATPKVLDGVLFDRNAADKLGKLDKVRASKLREAIVAWNHLLLASMTLVLERHGIT